MLSTDHFQLEFVAHLPPSRLRILRCTRTEQAMALENLVAIFAPLERSLATIDVANTALLLDLRRVVHRIDPAFEALTKPYINRLFTGFPRRATLVRSAIAVLQVNRLGKEAAASQEQDVFRVEAEAIAYLLR